MDDKTSDDKTAGTISGKPIYFKDLDLKQLEELMEEMGEKKFRAQQIAKWLFQRGVSSFEEMTDLSLGLRSQLQATGSPGGLGIIKKQVSSQDSTCKYLFKLDDGHAVEGVLMAYRHGFTACVSSQVGCRMGCKFCASGLDGLVRNLRPGEIYDQVLAMQKDTGHRVGNIVLMGSGEPLDNYENVLAFIRKVTSNYGLNIGSRHITLSTCGLVPQIKRLGAENIPITLAVSLHAPNNDLRDMLVPINRKYPLDKLLPVCRGYAETTGRRVTFEYALIAGVNDTAELAGELASRLKMMPLCMVNLIPANPVPERGIKRSPKNVVINFKNILLGQGINVTVRRELGADIDAACGQLRRRVIRNN